jgi:hypothetical protein
MSIILQHTKEALCFAHIAALAAMAGLNYRISPRQFDYGCDGEFCDVQVRVDPNGKTRRFETGFELKFQAKASVNWTKAGGTISYALEAKTYNDIVTRPASAPTKILILLCLPPIQSSWHMIDGDETKMQHHCYWAIPKGDASSNQQRVTINIPTENVLTVDMLSALMAEEIKRRKTS